MNKTNISSDPKKKPLPIDLNKILSVSDIKTLIEILLAHNSQDMKYWIPREVKSILNNEEVSAYLLAYLNTKDMVQSPRNFRTGARRSLKNSLFSRISKIDKIGEDWNFNVLSFDLRILHKNVLVVGCSSIYRKFGYENLRFRAYFD